MKIFCYKTYFFKTILLCLIVHGLLPLKVTAVTVPPIISYPQQSEKLLNAAISDFEIYIERAIRKEVSKLPDGKAGIVLQITNAPLSPTNPFESFEISASGNNIFIKGYTYKGLELGMYTLLDEWGFRWYLPGVEQIPQNLQLSYKGQKVYTPSFSYRNMFAQTGPPRCPPIDRKQELRKAIDDWERRNRLKPLEAFGGHHWTDFKNKYLAELQKHPEWTAEINGKRTGPVSNIKFCISNEAFRTFYINERVQEAKKEIQLWPEKKLWIVSVEPSDGDGHCTCQSCLAMGSVSTRVFFLANEVAKELKKLGEHVYASLYAYNKHAAVPDLEVHENVLVQLAPYKYQKVAKPRELINQWLQKMPNRLYLRDYYGLVLYNADMPLRQPFDSKAFYERLKQWRELGIQGANIESSYGLGATGLARWIFARFMFNSNLSLEEIEADYYSQYGNNATTVQEVHRLLAMPADSITNEPVISRQDMKKLLNLVVVLPQNRATDILKLYILYLHHLRTFMAIPHNRQGDKLQALDGLMELVWKQYWYNAVHSSGIANIYTNEKKQKPYIVAHMNTRWNQRNPQCHTAIAALELYDSPSIQKELLRVRELYTKE